MTTTVECDNVAFRYGRRTCITDISFTLRTGVTGLLGVNGAGKTTLMGILSTLRSPSSGRVFILGNDLSTSAGRSAAKRSLGYLPQSFEMMGFSSVLSNVEYSAWAHGVPGTDVHDAGIAALRAVDLLNLSTRRARTLSGGQRQRLGIACATVHRPDLLLLDEPTVGVDPLQRKTLRDMIAALGRRSTVLLSTHLVEDVARLADHVMIMHGGRLAYSGDTDDLVRTVPEAEDRAEAIETAFKAMAA